MAQDRARIAAGVLFVKELRISRGDESATGGDAPTEGGKRSKDVTLIDVSDSPLLTDESFKAARSGGCASTLAPSLTLAF